MIPFYSKRNQVFPVVWNGRKAVEKHFHCQEDWERELEVYRMLPLPHPVLLDTGHNTLVTMYCPYPTLLEELERQEKDLFSPDPWEKLAQWLAECSAEAQFLPGEGNLRNFLWDAETGCILGLDFEGYRSLPLQQSAAKIIAALLEYRPKDTPAKIQAAALLMKRLDVPRQQISAMREKLQHCRNKRKTRAFSGIILAGGRSTRMGRNKAELQLGGKTLLEHQVAKMRLLGIEEILLSGAVCTQLSGTRVIPDELPNRGPLGGLHACLHSAKNPQCLVLSVDTPLVPVAVLSQMCRAHMEGVTVLHHEQGEEPLIGVYDVSVAETILPLIAQGGAPVCALNTKLPWFPFTYMGPDVFLMNCNTPDEFACLEKITQQWGSLLK